MRFDEKSIVITGAGMGIGRVAAQNFASRGGLLTVIDLKAENAEKVAKEIQQDGGKAIPVTADVRDYNQVKSAVDRAISEYGKIDIMINNAGTGAPKPFAETKPEEWDYDIKICFYGVLNGCHSVINHMLERGQGRIVNVCSDAGRVGEPNLSLYSGAKGGVIAFSKALAQEVAKKGIYVNTICFGATKTENIQMVLETMPGMEEKMIKKYPIRRLAEMQDQANALMLISSEYASYIVGQTLSSNGGYSML